MMSLSKLSLFAVFLTFALFLPSSNAQRGKKGGCMRYGMSCWGGHGKRSGPQLELPMVEEKRFYPFYPKINVNPDDLINARNLISPPFQADYYQQFPIEDNFPVSVDPEGINLSNGMPSSLSENSDPEMDRSNQSIHEERNFDPEEKERIVVFPKPIESRHSILFKILRIRRK